MSCCCSRCPPPASPKCAATSRVLTPEQCRDELHLGPTVQLDDYPYVHMMRRVSQELRKLGHDGDLLRLRRPADEGAARLGHAGRAAERGLRRPDAPAAPPTPASAAEWLLDRFDAARAKVGAEPAFGEAAPRASAPSWSRAIEKDAAELLRGKNAGIADSLDGRDDRDRVRARRSGRRHAAAARRRSAIATRSRALERCDPCRARRSSTFGSRPRSRGARTPSAPIPTIPARSSTTACRWR